MKEGEIGWINTGVNARRREWGSHGYKAEKVTNTTTQSESMHTQDGEELILEFCGKTEK